MSDIFISYSKEDRDRAETLATALTEQGWSVFWDRTIPPGLTWRDFIGKELEEAACVLVGWSEVSVESRWVLEEAESAAKREILIPVLFETVDPPFGFGGLQAVDLAGWEGDANTSPFPVLVEGLKRLVAPSPVRVAEEPERAEVEDVRKAEEERQKATNEAAAEEKAETEAERKAQAAARQVKEEDAIRSSGQNRSSSSWTLSYFLRELVMTDPLALKRVLGSTFAGFVLSALYGGYLDAQNPGTESEVFDAGVLAVWLFSTLAVWVISVISTAIRGNRR